MEPTASSFYVTGGSLPSDTPSYIERRADQELFNALLAGEFCYVLTSRQMGKSSLMVRTAARLNEQGVQTAILDLTSIGQNVDPNQWYFTNQWYFSLLVRLGELLGLEAEVEQRWQAQPSLGPLRRFMTALEHCLLRCEGARERRSEGAKELLVAPSPPLPLSPSLRLVIFIDEIDIVRSLPFSTDEFFAAIRECYNRRTQDPAFDRLTFCLLGVASPSDLIRDVRLTPFNIGRRIELRDFTAEEAEILRIGLEVGDLGHPGRSEREARALLSRILYWTGGHPYLTQRLCQAVAANPTVHDATGVDRCCAELFLAAGASQRDDNLIFVRERLLKTGDDIAALLELYRQVWLGRRVPDDETNSLCSLLELSGITSARKPPPSFPTPHADRLRPFLRVRNRIYHRVFDQRWIRDHMPDAEVRRQRAAYRRGLARAASVAAVVLAMVGGLAGYALYQQRAAVRQRRLALQQQRIAEGRLARMDVTNGMRLAEEGDPLGALPWLADALRLEQGNAQREEMHRMRLASVLRQCPKLVQAWFHAGRVNSAEFSRDGHHVVTASDDRTARVWDALTGAPVTPPLEHRQPVRYACFSRDGRRVVTASGDPQQGAGEARVWDAVTGRPLTPPMGHAGAVVYAEFSPDGQSVVTAGDDATARVWNAATGKPAGPPLKHGARVQIAAFSGSGRRVVTVSDDGTARLWDVVAGRPVGPPLTDGRWLAESSIFMVGTLGRASLSADGRRLVALGKDSQIRIWDAATGERVTLTSELWNGGILDAAFSPNGQRVAATSGNGFFRVWDARTGRPVSPLLKLKSPGEHVSFSPDGEFVLTAGHDGTVQVMDAATGQPLGPPLKHSGHLVSASLGPGGRQVLTACADGAARLWDISTGAVPAPVFGGQLETGWYSPDGRRVVAAKLNGGGGPHWARVWDASSGKPVTPPLAHRDAVTSAAFSPDGTRVVTASRDRTARIWDAASGKPLTPPLKHRCRVNHASFSPDGRRVVTASGDQWPGGGEARIWDAATGRPLTPPMRHASVEWHAVFSPDGRRVAAAGGASARVWDAATGRPVTPPLRSRDVATRVASDVSFSPDGRRLVTAGADQTARVWDAATGRQLGPPLQHHAPVWHAEFSPSGEEILTASADGTARVWDAATSRPVTPPLRNGGMVQYAAFSPDGRRVVTSGGIYGAGMARVWDAGTGEPVTSPLKHSVELNSASFSPDGQRVLVVEWGANAGIWEVAEDTRPQADLLLLAALLSGERIDPAAGAAPLEPETLRGAWQTLRSRYPADFTVSAAEQRAWQEQEAEQFLHSSDRGLHELGEPHKVIALCSRAIRHDPENYRPWFARGWGYLNLRQYQKAVQDFSTAIRLNPIWPYAWKDRGGCYGALGRWQEALADFRREFELQPDDARATYCIAIAELAQGDAAGYMRTCAAMLAHFGTTTAPDAARWTAWTCCLAPVPTQVAARVVHLADRSAAKSPENLDLRHALGAALYRAARWQPAIAALQISISMPSPNTSPTYARFFLAMAHQRLGHRTEAKRWLKDAKQEAQKELAAKPPPEWNRRVTLQLLRREAEAVVAGRTPPVGPLP
jgi:WD40 repeat protein/tetratricopeptide (TPR) repeat protein